MSSRIEGELSLVMALALESCETDIENALQLLGRMAAPDFPVASGRVDAAVTRVTLPSRSIPPLGPLEEAVREAHARRDVATTPEEREALARAALWVEEGLLRARRGACVWYGVADVCARPLANLAQHLLRSHPGRRLLTAGFR